MNNKKPLLILLIIFPLLLACILALDARHLPLFVDEENLMSNVQWFAVERTIIPFFANYPTFYCYAMALPIYIVLFCVYLLKGYPLTGLTDAPFVDFVFFEHHTLVIWCARIISILCALVIIALLFWHSAKRYNLLAASIAGSILLLDPFNFYHRYCRYALPEIPITLLIITALFLLLQYIEKNKKILFYGACILTGLAMSSKLNASMALFPIVTAPFLNMREEKKLLASLRGIILTLCGFVAGSPVFLFAPQVYTAGFLTEATILFDSSAHWWQQQQWIWLLWTLWERNAATTVLAIGSIFYALYKRTKTDWLFLSVCIPSIAILGSLDKHALEYFIFLYPLCALQIGRCISELLPLVQHRWIRIAYLMCIVLMFVPAASKLYQKLRITIRPHNCAVAQEWIHNHISRDAIILLDWYYIPRLPDRRVITKSFLNKTEHRHAAIVARYLKKTPSYYVIRSTNLRDELTCKTIQGVDYLVTSSGIYDRFTHPSYRNQKQVVLMPEDIYSMRHRFYRGLFGGECNFRLIKSFSEGSGSIVNIFKNNNCPSR